MSSNLYFKYYIIDWFEILASWLTILSTDNWHDIIQYWRLCIDLAPKIKGMPCLASFRNLYIVVSQQYRSPQIELNTQRSDLQPIFLQSKYRHDLKRENINILRNGWTKYTVTVGGQKSLWNYGEKANFKFYENN